jgi:ABC-type amino acid transport substrate-binding protein
MSMQSSRLKRRAPLLVATLALTLLAAPELTRVAAASMTAPPLEIASVAAEAAAEGGALVTIEGAFPYDDVVGRDYAMQLFVRAVDDGSRFICFSTRWGPMVGSDLLYAKGLDAKNVDDIGRLALPSDRAHFVRVEPGQIQVQLEPDFPPGLAEAQFFVLYNGVPVFSNPVSFVIEEGDE